MAVKIYVCIALCDLAAGAPAPAIQQQTKRREFRFCFNFLGIKISIPREPLEMSEAFQFEEQCGRVKCTASIHDGMPNVVVAPVHSHSHHLRVRIYLYYSDDTMSERATDTGCYDTSGLSIQQDWQDALLEP